MSSVKLEAVPRDGGSGLRRREALKLLAGSMALAAAGCAKPHEEIMPYVEMPERLIPGIPLQFATTLALSGYGRGVIVTSHEGRPTKIEGNPRHPGSLGSTDVFAEAEIFNLYSPDRSQAVKQGHEIRSWANFAEAWRKRQEIHHADQGASLRLLTGRITSPTLLRQIKALQSMYPRMVWHAYEAADDEQTAAAQSAFRRRFDALPRVQNADVVLSLDSRFLDAGPRQIAMARAFADRRRVRRETKDMLRLYAAEPIPTLTGANSDHALVTWINAKLNAPVTYIDPIAGSDGQPGLQELAQSLNAGQVKTLIAIDCNPAYDAPADLDFISAMQKSEFRAHFSQIADETSAFCDWRLPASHALESWSDLRAFDGTVSIVQPLIEPLYDTRTAHDLIAILSGQIGAEPYSLVQDTWRSHASKDAFDGWWKKVLEEGVIPDTTALSVNPGEPTLPEIKPIKATEGATLVLSPDQTLWDGRYAANAWLQECPKPFTKQVWGNSLGINKANAAKLGLQDGDIVGLARNGRQVEVPVLVREGHAEGVISLALGGGRTSAGAIGTGVGVNAFAIRETGAPWVLDQVKIEKLPKREELAITTAVCEKAPCEPVCPVAASIHDSEGLNVQVYNRCVGTRFCEANCPYKVRRFNFFNYADGQEYKNLGAEVLHAQKNPDVTVRARGVMEKCTYCVQRISRARRQAEKENRTIRDGEVVTACAAACPTRAIHFGDLGQDAEVRRLRSEPQHYALLGDLGTRPRTTYLARVLNPNSDLVKGEG
jgi:molybdopterin-containing oxidoreductase family iron-sulfur binding subunit